MCILILASKMAKMIVLMGTNWSSRFLNPSLLLGYQNKLSGVKENMLSKSHSAPDTGRSELHRNTTSFFSGKVEVEKRLQRQRQYCKQWHKCNFKIYCIASGYRFLNSDRSFCVLSHFRLHESTCT